MITIGFTPDVYANFPKYQTDKSWFHQVKNLFWRLRFPANSIPTRQALDRPEITTQIYEMVLYPQMVWAGPVDADLRRTVGKLLPKHRHKATAFNTRSYRPEMSRNGRY